MSLTSILKKIPFLATLNQQQNKQINKLNELQWSAVFNQGIQDSSWLKNKSFFPGGWAVGFPFLTLMYRILEIWQPIHILEFGLGESTKMTSQFIKANPETQLTVIEQDENWIGFASKKLQLPSNGNIQHCPLINTIIKNQSVKSYGNFQEKIQGQKFDMILIDGPHGSPNYSRYEIISIIENNQLAETFVILFDDTHRIGEKQTLQDIISCLKQKNIDFAQASYKGEKNMSLICSADVKFFSTMGI